MSFDILGKNEPPIHNNFHIFARESSAYGYF